MSIYKSIILNNKWSIRPITSLTSIFLISANSTDPFEHLR